MRFLIISLVVSGCIDGAASDPPVSAARVALGADALDRGAPRLAKAGPSGDIVLASAWRPRSGARVDCGGRTVRGAPVLLYLLDVENVTVANCVFADADFAIIAVRGGGHTIKDNRFENIGDTSIWFVASSSNEVRDNAFANIGAGVMVNGNGDHNRAHHNTLRGADIGFGAYWTPDQAVINVIVDGELTQVPNEVDRLDDYRVWSNDIEVREDGFIGVGLMGGTRDGSAWENRIRGGALGVASWGYEDWLPVVLPGTCSLDPSRLCSPDQVGRESDCFLPGYDSRSKGICLGAQTVPDTRPVIRSTFADNDIAGAFTGAELYLAPSTRFVNNDVSSCTHGIVIGDWMLQSGVVTGNIVRDSQIGLVIDNWYATYAGAEVAFNDFYFSAEAAVATQNDGDCWHNCRPMEYAFPTDLSLNHWGRTCAQGASPVFADDDLTGRPAYGAPVASAYRRAASSGRAIDPAALGPLCD